jgi:long-chain acyl-CoA synthetase
MNKTIPSLFQSSVEKNKDRIAFNYFDGSWKAITYEEFFLLSNSIASFLISNSVNKGDRVAIVSENRPEWCAAYMAIMMCGGIAVPIDIQLGSNEIKNLLMDSETKIVFYCPKTEPNVLKAVEGTDIKSINFDANKPMTCSYQPSVLSLQPEDIASIIYTSGTTGKPKGVVLTHENFCSDAEAVIQAGVVAPDDNVLSILPFHHTYPFMCTFIVPVFVGATITFSPGLKAADIVLAIKERAVTIVVGVPRLFEAIRNGIISKIKDKKLISRPLILLMHLCGFVRRRFDINAGKVIFKSVHRNFGTLRFFASGGARLDPSVMNDLESLGFTVLEGYGLTETSPVITFNPVKKRKPASTGKPLPGVEIKISNTGEIMVKGPMVMKGYYKNPSATADAIKDGWLLTGDTGHMDNEGYLFITGRKKEVIVLGSGKNVYPEDVEKFFASIPLIKEICVTEKGGLLHAVIVPDVQYAKVSQAGNISETLRWKINEISSKLPEYMRVRGFTLYSESLPRTPLGKLRRFMVREIAGRAASEARIVKEDDLLVKDDIGKKVAECIMSLMKDKITVNSTDNIELDLGFDSLKRIELISALESVFSLSLPDTFITEIQTVGDVVARLKKYLEEGSLKEEKTALWKNFLEKPPASEDLKRIGFSFSKIELSVIHVLWLIHKAIFKILFRLEVKGKEHIPAKGPYIIAPNHVSFLDGFVIASSVSFEVFKDLYFLGFQKYFTGAVLRWFGRASHVIPIDPGKYLSKAMQVSAYVLRNKKSLCIFPEGGRSFDGEVMSFKKGIGVLAGELNIPVIPAFIKGSFKALPRGSMFIRPAKIEVIFGKPVAMSDIDLKQKPADIEKYQFFADELRSRVVALKEKID